MSSVRELTITHRGVEDVVIKYTDDGYDPDTGDSGIEWWFEDPSIEYNDAEEWKILERIVEDSHRDPRD